MARHKQDCGQSRGLENNSRKQNGLLMSNRKKALQPNDGCADTGVRTKENQKFYCVQDRNIQNKKTLIGSHPTAFSALFTTTFDSPAVLSRHDKRITSPPLGVRENFPRLRWFVHLRALLTDNVQRCYSPTNSTRKFRACTSASRQSARFLMPPNIFARQPRIQTSSGAMMPRSRRQSARFSILRTPCANYRPERKLNLCVRMPRDLGAALPLPYLPLQARGPPAHLTEIVPSHSSLPTKALSPQRHTAVEVETLMVSLRLNNFQILILSRLIPPTQRPKYPECFTNWNSSSRLNCSTKRESTRWPSYTRQMVTRSLAQMQRANEWRAKRKSSSYKPPSSDTRIYTY